MRDGLHDRPGPLGWVSRLKDPRPHEHAIAPELHHERSVGRRGNASSGKVDHWEPSQGLCLAHELDGGPDFLGVYVQLVVVHVLQRPDGTLDGPRVPDGLNDVPSPGLSLGPDHGCTLGDTPQCLSKIPASAYERHLEVVLVDVVQVISWREHLGLVNVVDSQRLEDLRLHEVANPRLSHDWNCHSLLDLLDHARVAHSSHTSVPADVGRDTLKSHDRDGTRLLGDTGLFGSDNVHDYTTLKHLGQAHLRDREVSQSKVSRASLGRTCVAVAVRTAAIPPRLGARSSFMTINVDRQRCGDQGRHRARLSDWSKCTQPQKDAEGQNTSQHVPSLPW